VRASALRDRARQYGIETSYIDAAGKRQQASKDALAAAVALRSARVREPRPFEPVVVAWGSAPPEIATLDAATEWDLALEDGSWRAGRGPIREALPHGYHVLRILSHEGVEHEILIIAAPRKAQAPRERAWGLFAPLYAAHTRRSWGAGDLGDLLSYASWIGHYDGSVVATLPMLAAFDDEPSPYSPVSRLFWNELYLDVTRLPELRVDDDIDLGAIAHLRQMPLVDHAAVRREKRRVLERCAARFAPDIEFEKFAAGEAGEYARFMAATPEETRYHLYVQYRLAQQMREVANVARRLGTGLYLDFPLGVHPDGYDASRYAHVFAKNVSVGAPPDLFFTKGQNWGFAPFDPDAMRENRYDYFRKAIRNHVAHAGILRIDHVMGLHRLFWIPNGLDAKDGVYVRYNAEELYAIVTLESRRHGCTVVGEDLGTVPPEVPRMMKRHGLRQMYVVQYEAKPEEQPLNDPPRESVASINTHDMPTFAGWWNGRDIDDRVTMGLLDEVGARRERETRERIRRALSTSPDARQALEELLVQLASSEAEIVLINLEDLWGELEPQNVPGVRERSWRQKFRLGLEDAMADGSIRRVLTNVGERRAHGTVRDPENRMKEG
jgi:4-alpha-glucanotransferase